MNTRTAFEDPRSTYEARQRRAYRLYVGYKTQTFEYRRLAESFGLSTGELNSQMCDIYNAKRRERDARRIERKRRELSPC